MALWGGKARGYHLRPRLGRVSGAADVAAKRISIATGVGVCRRLKRCFAARGDGRRRRCGREGLAPVRTDQRTSEDDGNARREVVQNGVRLESADSRPPMRLPDPRLTPVASDDRSNPQFYAPRRCDSAAWRRCRRAEAPKLLPDRAAACDRAARAYRGVARQRPSAIGCRS